MSRACAAPTPEHRCEHPSVLMPFLDLLNHGESCRHETEGGSAVIVAAAATAATAAALTGSGAAASAVT